MEWVGVQINGHAYIPLSYNPKPNPITLPLSSSPDRAKQHHTTAVKPPPGQHFHPITSALLQHGVKRDLLLQLLPYTKALAAYFQKVLFIPICH